MSGKYKGNAATNEEVYDVTSLGSGLKINSRKQAEFTQKKAIWLLEECGEFTGDRPLKQTHVNNLVTAMQRGTFHPEWVTIITCRLNDKIYRMNGQHTAWARLEMSEVWPCKVEFIEYLAESEEDMRTLYSSVDRSSPRTKANVIHSYLAGTPEFANINAGIIRIIASGFPLWFWKTGAERKRHDGDDVAYLLKTDHYDLAIKVVEFLSDHKRSTACHVYRASVIAAMFATFDKAPEIAKKFWGPVCDGVGFEKKGDPRNKLRTKLLQHSVDTGAGSGSGKKSMTAEYMLRLCIVAWNAYREDKSLTYLKSSESGRRPRVHR